MKFGIFDSPARSFVLYTKGHSGYYSCSQCTVKGIQFKKRRIFVNTNEKLRTDKSFKKRKCCHYHQGNSLLEQLNMGMVSQVPLDYLHVVCLGVVKRFCFVWVSDKSNDQLDDDNIFKLSQRLKKIIPNVPNEFARKPRAIEMYKRWKGTEFRSFILYYAMIVMHEILDKTRYEHLLCLVVALRILISRNPSPKHINYSEKLLKCFVDNIRNLYCKTNYTHNVHNLIHLPNNVRQHGPLDNYSAFPFEDFMSEIKRMIRKPNSVVAQIFRRCGEQNSNFVVKDIDNGGSRTINPKLLHQTLNTYQACQTKTTYFRNCDANSGIKLKDQTFGKILNFRHVGADIVFDYNELTHTTDLFKRPCLSSKIGIYVGIIDEEVKTANLNEIDSKICLLPLNVERSKYCIQPLLHN